MQERSLGLAIDPLAPAPATVVIHGDPAPFLDPVEPVLILLEVDLNAAGFPDIQDFVAVGPNFGEVGGGFLPNFAVMLVEFQQEGIDFSGQAGYI